jgi:glycopeptide antibiotics resistance protein
VLYGGTIPFHFAVDHASIAHKLHALPLSPWISPETGRRLSIPDVVQNVLFFVPFGIFGMLAGGVRGRWSRLFWVTASSFLLSLLVETLQLLENSRVTSVADLTTNSIGAGAGAVLAFVGRGVALGAWPRLQSAGLAGVREIRPLAIWTVVLVVTAWQPFDVTLDVGTVASKVRGLQSDLWQFTVLRDEGLVGLVTSLFVMSLAAYLSAIGVTRAGRRAAFAGTAIFTILEGSQILISSRMPSAWDVAVGTCGALAGAAIWSVSRGASWQRLGLATISIATAAAAAMAMLSPFQISPEYHTVGWLPLLGYYARTTFETVSHVIELALLYFPLGYGFAASSLPARRARALALGIALVIAAPVEALQGWVIGRYPDLSDLLFSVVGTWIGLSAGRTVALTRSIFETKTSVRR